MRYVLPLIVALCLALAGCSTWHGDYVAADGTQLHVGGGNLVQTTTIDGVTATGPNGLALTLTGFQKTGDAATVKAVMDGAAAVTGAAVKAAVAVKP